MADNFGLVNLPASAADVPVGDPALLKLGNFIQAVVNAQCEAAWVAAQPTPGGTDTPLIKTVASQDPTQRGFNTAILPALFLWRVRGSVERTAERWFMITDTVNALWIPPALPQEEQRNRDTFWPLVGKSIASALERRRDPSWFDAGDTDPTAISYPAIANSILLSRATLTTQVTYSGAQLDGSIGGSTMSPRREVSVTTSVATGAYNTTANISVVCVNWSGSTVTKTIKLTQANGGETIGIGEDIVSVTSVTFPAQTLTTGSFQVGTSAVVGRGSQLLQRTFFEHARMVDWQIVAIKVEAGRPILDGDQDATFRLPYIGLQATLEVRELFQSDVSTLPTVNLSNPNGPGVAININRIDGSTIETAQFPDHGTN